jgi:hypothetical protein
VFDNGDVEPVFNFQVGGHRTYFVVLAEASLAILVHNSSGKDKQKQNLGAQLWRGAGDLWNAGVNTGTAAWNNTGKAMGDVYNSGGKMLNAGVHGDWNGVGQESQNLAKKVNQDYQGTRDAAASSSKKLSQDNQAIQQTVQPAIQPLQREAQQLSDYAQAVQRNEKQLDAGTVFNIIATGTQQSAGATYNIANDASNGELGKAVNTFNQVEHDTHFVERGLGVLQALGGIGEMGAGVVGVGAPTGVTQVLGAMAIVHGFDNYIHGLSAALTGTATPTATAQLATMGAQNLGANPTAAAWIGAGVDFAAGMGLPHAIPHLPGSVPGAATFVEDTAQLSRGGSLASDVENAAGNASRLGEAGNLGEHGMPGMAGETGMPGEIGVPGASHQPGMPEEFGQPGESLGGGQPTETMPRPAEPVMAETPPEVTSGCGRFNEEGTIGCFARGTRLLTPTGSLPIEQLLRGFVVLARPEDDPNGPVEAKVVEDLFVRTARIMHLHVGGDVIRTTEEHAFYAAGRGWVGCWALGPGDELLSHDGRRSIVEDVFDTGEYETVYNVQVHGFHTYFVGGQEGSLSVWSHNNDLCGSAHANAEPTLVTSPAEQSIVAQVHMRSMGTYPSNEFNGNPLAAAWAPGQEWRLGVGLAKETAPGEANLFLKSTEIDAFKQHFPGLAEKMGSGWMEFRQHAEVKAFVRFMMKLVGEGPEVIGSSAQRTAIKSAVAQSSFGEMEGINFYVNGWWTKGGGPCGRCQAALAGLAKASGKTVTAYFQKEAGSADFYKMVFHPH